MATGLFVPEGYSLVIMEFSTAQTGETAMMTFGISQISSNDAAATAQDIHSYFSDDVMPDVSDTVALERVVVKFGPLPDGFVGEYTDTTTGGATGDACTPQVCVLIKKASLVGGRRNHGRFYQPGVIEGAVNEAGQLDSGNVTTYQANYDSFFSDLVNNDYPMQIFHNDEAVVPTGVERLQVETIVATQRRRLRR